MFKRQLLQELDKWRLQKRRKPLVIRGARQVGKTTLVNQFAIQYDQYIYLNLELAEDKEPFEKFTSIETLVNTLFFLKNKTLAKKIIHSYLLTKFKKYQKHYIHFDIFLSLLLKYQLLQQVVC